MMNVICGIDLEMSHLQRSGVGRCDGSWGSLPLTPGY